MEIFKEFTFDAAHWLPNVPVGHKCGNLHGHTYKLVVGVKGPVNRFSGFVMDFGDLKEIVKYTVIDRFDHQCLNNMISNPTAENLVNEIWESLSGEGLRLSFVELWETPTSGARRCST